MYLYNESVPAFIVCSRIKENKRLLKELEEIKIDLMRTKKENALLKRKLRIYQGNIQKITGPSSNCIIQSYSKSSSEKNISVESIVKLMQEEGISSLSQVAELLDVSYATVLERLRLNVHPTQKSAIE